MRKSRDVIEKERERDSYNMDCTRTVGVVVSKEREPFRDFSLEMKRKQKRERGREREKSQNIYVSS